MRSSCRILPGASPVAGVDPAALAPGQRAQRARGQRPAEGQQQPGGPDAVPAEQGQVPRRAGAQEHLGRARGRWPAAARPRRAGPERAGGPAAGRRRRRARRPTGRRPRRAAGRRRRPGRRRSAPRPTSSRPRAASSTGQLSRAAPSGLAAAVAPGAVSRTWIGPSPQVSTGPTASGPAPGGRLASGGPGHGPVIDEYLDRGRGRACPVLISPMPARSAATRRVSSVVTGTAAERGDPDLLADPAGADQPLALHPDGRVGAVVAEVADQADEQGPAGVEQPGAERLGLGAADLQHGGGQHPARRRAGHPGAARAAAGSARSASLSATVGAHSA